MKIYNYTPISGGMMETAAVISSRETGIDYNKALPERTVNPYSSVIEACKNFGRRYLPILAFLASLSAQGCGSKDCSTFETATCERIAKAVGLRYAGCAISSDDKVNCQTAYDGPDGGGVNNSLMKPCTDNLKKEECRVEKKDCYVFQDLLDKSGQSISICVATKARPNQEEAVETTEREQPVDQEDLSLPEEKVGGKEPLLETVADGSENQGEGDIEKPADQEKTEEISLSEPETKADAAVEAEPVLTPETNIETGGDAGVEPGPETGLEPDLRPETGQEPIPEQQPEPAPEPQPELATDKSSVPLCSATPTGDPDIKWHQQLNMESTDPLARGCFTDATGQSCGDFPNGVRHSPIDQAMCKRYAQPGITPRAMIWAAANSAAMIRFLYHKSEGKITFTRFFRATGKKNPGGIPQIIAGSEQSLNVNATTYDYDLHQAGKPQWSGFIGTWPSSGSGKPDDVGAPIPCALSPAEIQQGADSCVIGAEFEVK